MGVWVFDKFGFKKIINPNKKFLENILFGLIFIILISASAIIGGGIFASPKIEFPMFMLQLQFSLKIGRPKLQAQII